MANLPIPDFGLTTAEAPRSSVSGDIFRTAPQQSIAPGLAALGEGVDALAVKAAESQARQDLQKAVTRDADGNVQVATPDNNFILGRAGEAYQRTFEHGSLSALQNQNAQALTELRQQFPLDPQGFKVAAAKYTEGLRSKFPGALGEAAYVNASHLTTQHYDGLVNAKAAQDVQNSFQEITTRIQGLKNDMLQMARQDGVETEAFGNSAGMLKAQYDALVANPRFGFTKQKAEYEIDNFRKEAADQFVIGKVRQVRDKEGTDAARAWAEREIRDKKGGVPQENDARFNMALGEIGRLTDQQRANAAAANDDASKIVNLFHAGKPPSDDQIDAAIENSKRNFDASGAMALENARQAYKRGIAPTMGVSAQGMAAAGIGPVSWQTVHGAIIKQESGGNPLAPKSVTGATGIGQIQPETFKQYARPGERIDNPADNLAVSQRIVQDLYQKAGGDPARVAVGYFSGPGNIAPPGAPTPYKEDKADPTGKTTSSYVADVVKRLGGTMTGGGSSPIRFTAPELAGHPGLAGAAASQYLSDQKLMSHVVNQQVEAIGGMVKMGILAPDAVQIASIQQIAAQHPSLAPKVQELEATVSAAKTLQANANSPSPVDGAQIVEQARQIAKTSPSIAGYQFVQSLQEQANAQAKQIKDSPLGYAGRVGWSKPPQPLNFDNHDALTREMASRADAAVRFNSRMGYMPDILQSGEMDQVKQLVDFGSTQQKAAFISSLAQLPRAAMMSTMKQLASDNQTMPLAMAARVSMDNPQAAQAILEGQALLKSDPKLGADKDLREVEWNKTLPISDVKDPQVRTAMEEGVNSTYAWLSAQANDMSGSFKKDRYRQAVQMVTGGVIDFRGSKVLAPWYGATEGQMTHALNSLTADDLKGAVLANGEAFPARELQTRSVGDSFGSSRWRLETVGPGKYLVFSGDTTARRYLQNSAGAPFILNLAPKKTSENAVIPNFIAPPPGALLSKEQIIGGGAAATAGDKVRPLPVSPEIGS